MTKEVTGKPSKPQKPARLEGGLVKDEVALVLRWHDGPAGVQVLGMSRDTAKALASNLMMGLPVNTLDDMSQAALIEFVRIYSLKARMSLADQGKNPTLVIPSALDPWDRPPRLGQRALHLPLEITDLGHVNLYLDLDG